jgi:hypothetical protein
MYYKDIVGELNIFWALCSMNFADEWTYSWALYLAAG